jgi:hypothetical protein
LSDASFSPPQPTSCVNKIINVSHHTEHSSCFLDSSYPKTYWKNISCKEVQPSYYYRAVLLLKHHCWIACELCDFREEKKSMSCILMHCNTH